MLEMFEKHCSHFNHNSEQSYLGMAHSVTHAKRATNRTPTSSHEQSIKIK